MFTDYGTYLRNLAKTCPDQKKRFRIYMISLCLTFLSMLLYLLAVTVKSLISPSCTNVNFSPHTSIAFEVSGIYCDHLILAKYQDNSPASQWNTSLYLLHQMPNLSTIYNFTLSEDITLSANEFYKQSFYLNNGSTDTLSACKTSSSDSNTAHVCVIGGKNNFNNWNKMHSCKHPYVIKSMCNGSTIGGDTHSGVIEESKMYYFIFFINHNRNGIEISFQVDMTFNTVEYAVEQSDIFQECTLADGKDQSCSIGVPLYFRGAVLLATSGPSDLPEVWKDALPVSWKCESTIKAHAIYMFLPATVTVCLLFLWWASLVCALRYCSNHRIQRAKMIIVAFMVVSVVVITICFGINILGANKITTAISWSCRSIHIQGRLATYAIIYFGLYLIIFVCSIKFLKQKNNPGDQRASDSTRQGERQSDSSKKTKRIIITILITFVILTSMIIAASFTYLIAIKPVLMVYSPSVTVLTPGDTKIFSFDSRFVSSVSMDYVGSPHLSATLYVSDEQPPLSKYTSYGTSESLLCNQSECTHLWQSYLNWNSSVDMHICLNESSGVNAASFCVIKGMNSDTFDISQIQVQPGDTKVKCSTLTQSNRCFEWTLHIDDTHAKSDRYFFILKEYNFSLVDVDLQFNRTDYFPDYTDVSKVDSCTINSHTIDSCTAHLQSKKGTSTALIVVKSDLDTPLFKWQETISITTGYNYRADTWTGICLAVFVVNCVVVSIFYLLCIKLRLKLQKPAKPKSDFLAIVHNRRRVCTDHKELNEQALPLELQQDSLSKGKTDDQEDTNDDITSTFVTQSDVPEIQSLVVSVDITPDSAANSDDEHGCHGNDGTMASTRTSPVEPLKTTIIDSEVECIENSAKQRANTNVAAIVVVQKDDSEAKVSTMLDNEAMKA